MSKTVSSSKPAPQGKGEVQTSERLGTDGSNPGSEMEHDFVDSDGVKQTFSCFVSTRHNKYAVVEKLAAGWRVVDKSEAAPAAESTEPVAAPADTEVSDG